MGEGAASLLAPGLENQELFLQHMSQNTGDCAQTEIYVHDPTKVNPFYVALISVGGFEALTELPSLTPMVYAKHPLG